MRSYDYGRGAYSAKFILNPRTRILYAKHWWWQMHSQSTWHSLTEIRGAACYCLVRLLRAVRSRRSDLESVTVSTGQSASSATR